MASSSPSSPRPGSSDDAPAVTKSIPRTLWESRIPLYITHRNNELGSPFIAAVPRFSYLAQLLPRLSSFYGVPCSSFHHETIQLRNLALGLLVDLYQPQLPWHLVVGDGDEWDIGDTFLNCVKEVSLETDRLGKISYGDTRPAGESSYNQLMRRILSWPFLCRRCAVSERMR